ncbi:hypothetical protein BVI434_410123 [Burkholderia vietnamiensis]|nr:hypothetical protein BVI434_410123 [Burkholderia vietnamiensis]
MISGQPVFYDNSGVVIRKIIFLALREFPRPTRLRHSSFWYTMPSIIVKGAGIPHLRERTRRTAQRTDRRSLLFRLRLGSDDPHVGGNAQAHDAVIAYVMAYQKHCWVISKRRRAASKAMRARHVRRGIAKFRQICRHLASGVASLGLARDARTGVPPA